jgi:hypothetical protein
MNCVAYLIKRALDEERPDLKSAIKGAIGANVLGALGLAPSVLGLGMGMGATLSGRRELSAKRLRRLRDYLRARAPIVETFGDPLSKFLGIPMGAYATPDEASRMIPFMSPDEQRRIRQAGVVLTGSKPPPAIVAHELGHSSGSKALLRLHNLGQMAIGPAGALAGILASDPDESMGKSVGRGALYGAAAGGTVGLPMLIEEARASLRGLRGLEAAGMRRPLMANSRKALALAFGTYLLGALGGGALSGASMAPLGRWGKGSWRETQREKGKAKA